MSSQIEIKASRKTELPEGWENYSICKDKIPDTPFLAFKVPLSQEIQGRYNEKMKKYMDSRRKTGMKARPIMFTNWTVKEIEKKYSNMDLIIDLTNTHKYYDPAELPNSMKHVKIKSKGGGPVPDSKVVQKFYQAVDETLSKKKDALIGVHSTHGVNRCGYLICRYLIEKLNWPAQKAIDEFNKSRGHQIEHKNYIDDLIAANWNDPPKKEKPEVENTSEGKVIRSVSLNVPQDSVEKPPSTGDFEKMKARRQSAYPRMDAVEDSTKQKSLSGTPSPRVLRSTSTVAEIEKERSPKLTGTVSRSGSGAGSGSKKTLQVPGQQSFDEEVEIRKERKDSVPKLKLKIPLKTQTSVEFPRGSLSPGISSSVPKGNNMLTLPTEISPKESPSGSKSKLSSTEISTKDSPSDSKSKVNKKDSLESPRGSLSPGVSSSVPKGNNMLIVPTISPKESPAGSKNKLTVPTEISPKESPSGSKSKLPSTEISSKDSPSGSKSKLNKKDSLEEKEKRGSKVSRSKSSVEKLDKTDKTQTSLPLGDSKTYESPLTTALKSDPKKYTSRKKTAPL